MSFGKNKPHKRLPTSKSILNVISERDIFEFYLGGVPSKTISSPFREDLTPSFSLFYSHNHEKILFKDFSTEEVGDCFILVMKLFNFNKVAVDFNLDQFELNNTSIVSLPVKSKYKKSKLKVLKDKLRVTVTVRNWKIKDKEYWKDKYNLSKEQLEYCNVYPISHYFLNGYCVKAKELSYAFAEYKDGKQTFKIYQPYADKDDKWKNNNDRSTWELWTQMPDTGETLIITSSRKDAMVIKSLFNSQEITSCSLQSEGVIPKESVVNELKRRFKNIFVLYDNDFDNEKNPGRRAALRLCHQTGFKHIEIPSSYKKKDPSDFIEKYGAKSLKELILKEIINIKKIKS